jgi:hypothetical protein
MLLLGMPIDARELKTLIEVELRAVHDDRVANHILSLLVEPRATLRDWDYGAPGQQHLCWIVLDDGSDTGIAYCEEGFGPRCPWGLVSAAGGDGWNSIGMDSGWFPTFMEAYFESMAATDLPIWRVFLMDRGRPARPLTDELAWAEAWERCEAARQGDPVSRFMVWHSIVYGS